MSDPSVLMDEDDPSSMSLSVEAPALIDIDGAMPQWSAEDLRVCFRAAVAVLEAEGANLDGVEVSLSLQDDAAVQALNQAYRGKDKPTNVLSFPTYTPADVRDAVRGAQAGEGPPVALGDLAVAAGVLAREAQEHGKARADHLSHLVVHGILHLLGHDHMTDTDADAMEALEVRILESLHVFDPYRERTAPLKHQDAPK